MERLQTMLRQYNLLHIEDLTLAPWSKQYCEETFPKYWEIVFSILQSMDKNAKVLEIGCGLGDITAILCYLGFKHVTSFEKDKQISNAARRRIIEIFGLTDIVYNENYPNGKTYDADILILVNCAYADMAKTKEEYMNLMKEHYIRAGNPKYFLMEVIDSSYIKNDEEFPKHIRLSYSDVCMLFPNYAISSWETYKYPVNRKSKTLYLIERQ